MLYWCSGFEDPTYDINNIHLNPEFGELVIGISTDDNLEATATNSKRLAHLSVICKAFADNGLETVSEDDPNQIIGVAINYTPTIIEHPKEILGIAIDYSGAISLT